MGDQKEQVLNTRTVRLLTLDGATNSLNAWAKAFGMSDRGVERRLRKWGDLAEAILAPKLPRWYDGRELIGPLSPLSVPLSELIADMDIPLADALKVPIDDVWEFNGDQEKEALL